MKVRCISTYHLYVEEAVEQMEVCGSPKPNEPYFTITLVNVAGSPEVDAVSPEQTIKLKGESSHE